MSDDRTPRRVAVISDTHFPRCGTRLPAACLAELAAADLILHAGDWSDMDAVRVIRAVGPPVVGVAGNVESPGVRAAMPEKAEVEVAGHTIGVVHDAGPAAGRTDRLGRRFPAAEVIVFGHSHIPWVASAGDGRVTVNPGSPTDRRGRPHHTMAVLDLAAGRLPEVRLLIVDDPPGPLPPELIASG